MIARRILLPSSCACCALFLGLPIALVRAVRCSDDSVAVSEFTSAVTHAA
jgi:hypothetical protein